MNTELTEDQKTAILTRSREAQAFLASPLYQELEKWLKQEQDLTAAAMATNIRTKNEENLSRAEFLERKSAYWLALPTVISVFKQFAEQDKILKEIEEQNAKSEH